jgi:hypothetical protein
MVFAEKVPAGWSAPLVGAGYWGASRTLLERASASGGCVLAAGFVPTSRIPPHTDPRSELNSLTGSVKSPGEVLGKPAAHAWQGDLRKVQQSHPESISSVQRDFRFALTHSHRPSQAKAFSATLAGVTRAHAPCSINFWMSFDLAPTRYDFASGEAELSVRFTTLASIFFDTVNINQRLLTAAL